MPLDDVLHELSKPDEAIKFMRQLFTGIGQTLAVEVAPFLKAIDTLEAEAKKAEEALALLRRVLAHFEIQLHKANGQVLHAGCDAGCEPCELLQECREAVGE